MVEVSGHAGRVEGVDGRAKAVGRKAELLSAGCTADQTNWLLPDKDLPRDWTRCEAKVRYNSQPSPARVRMTGDDSFEVAFDEPMEAVTPGQAVVCYRGQTVMGGGWIRAAT